MNNTAFDFIFDGIRGHIDRHNWVLFGNCGFHLEDITGPLREFLDRARGI